MSKSLWRNAHLEQARGSEKRYRERHREELRRRQRIWRETHKEELHHPDYNYPEIVVTCCLSCHRWIHNSSEGSAKQP